MKTVSNQEKEINLLKQEKINLNRENHKLNQKICNFKKLRERKLQNMKSVAIQTNKDYFICIDNTKKAKQKINPKTNMFMARWSILGPILWSFIGNLLLHVFCGFNCSVNQNQVWLAVSWISVFMLLYLLVRLFYLFFLYLMKVVSQKRFTKKRKYRLGKCRRHRKNRQRNWMQNVNCRKKTRALFWVTQLLLPGFIRYTNMEDI